MSRNSTNITVDTRELRKISIQLSKFPKQIPSATAAALNRTVDFTSTKTVKEVTNQYAIKAKDVRATIKKYKASRTNLNASIESTGNTISLTHFPHKPTKYRKKSKNVKVKIKKKEGYKVIGTAPKAFVQNMNGNTNIWKREGSSRFPVVVLRTLSIPQMVSNKKILKTIKKEANKKLEERTKHEVEWRLNKIANRTRR